jgi:hypothetical protein
VNSGSCWIAEGRHLLVIEAWSGPIFPDLGAVPQDAFGVKLHAPKATRERPLLHARWERGIWRRFRFCLS